MPPPTSMDKSTTDESWNSDTTKRKNKKLEAAVRDTAIQMGCWTASDDYLLIVSVLHVCDLERVHERVKFSMPFTLKNIRDRWRCLLYDAPISKMIVSKVQQLSALQIEHLRIPFSQKEEQLLASIPSHTIPALLDAELNACLTKYSQDFWSNRTVDELRECWLQMRADFRLNDQKNTDSPPRAAQAVKERASSMKLGSLLAPFEFELLSRNNEKFAGKTELPHALLHVNNRIYCMYSDQLSFGTCLPDTQFDIVFDNSTSVHIQGMIVLKSGLFYIINNGSNAFRVNDGLLNANEASPLGTRAVINILAHTMIFQAIEIPG